MSSSQPPVHDPIGHSLGLPIVHPIVQQSFALIDQEFGAHDFSPDQYEIVRRIVHSTADFDFKHWVQFSPGAIAAGITALQQGAPIIVDVTMVRQGIHTLVGKTFGNPIMAAVEYGAIAAPGKTRTETGLLHCLEAYPQGIYVIGNAPTALLALCQRLATPGVVPPALVIGAPVGFVAVLEAKQALANCGVPQIRVDGRKGGSPVAAAIVNALLVMAWAQR